MLLGLTATPFRSHDEEGSRRLAQRFDCQVVPRDQVALYQTLRQQQILADETGIADVADPLGGSWAVEALTDRIKAIAKAGYDERIYVRGSKAVNYGRVAQVMSLVTSAGYKKVALVTEQEK